jgi:arginine/lysine/ornithine decarboxylase
MLRQEYLIEPEMVALDYVIAMTGMGDSEETIKRFCDAILDIDSKIRKRPRDDGFCDKITVPQKVMEAKEALSEKCVQLALCESVGKVSGEYVWAYPPGAPILVPGEKITEDVVSQIFSLCSGGVSVHSTAKDIPYCIFCVDKPY